jgi:cytochrome c oxidase subunit 2
MTVSEYDSYLMPVDELLRGQKQYRGGLRLLEVDRRVILPEQVSIRVLTSAADVIHSWAIPSYGFKTDAVPGRSNQGSLILRGRGVAFGQCSELCGANHGLMPIGINVLSESSYLRWVNTALGALYVVPLLSGEHVERADGYFGFRLSSR